MFKSGSFFAVLGIIVALSASGPVVAQTAKADFTDSTAAGLSGTKRVAITGVVVSFQASIADEAGPGAMFRMLQSKETAQTVLSLPYMDPALQETIASLVYQDLRNDLTAAGFEVVPEAEVKATTEYQKIVGFAGIPNHSQFANAAGDAMLVSPPSLTPYLPYNIEASSFSTPKSYLGWVSAMGAKSVTPGGPSYISISNNWKLPGMEVALAKALNANVVKAFYVVTIGRATAARHQSFEAAAPIADMSALGGFRSGGINRTVTANGAAMAQVGLLHDQSRIAFRTPNGNAKWQKVSVLKPVPAKDGDVVVRLAEPLQGGTDYFTVSGSSGQRGFLQGGADFQFSFTASLADPVGYGREVVGMIASADKAMIDLIKR